jgi:NAD(P)-dependent dehydrogenase (short-subunit alcohol dehydrogenase family)
MTRQSPLHARSTRAAGLLGAAAFLMLAAGATAADAQAGSAPAADQRVALVTGSTDGLGREVALRLGSSGAHVIVHGRNQERGMEVVRQIEAEGEGSARFYAADLASMAQVQEFAETILRDYERIDVLVNNAGIWWSDPERSLSPDGYEMHMAVNYLSGFLLTHRLLPLIVESAPARSVNVASSAQTPIDFDDVMIANNYSGGRAYGQSKLSQILFTVDLAEELEGTGVIVAALHPATLMETTLVIEAGAQPRSTVDEGATAVMNLIESPDIPNGQYFNGLRPVQANAQAYDAEARARLRELSRELTGL